MFYLVEVFDDDSYGLVNEFDNFDHAMSEMEGLKTIYPDSVYEIMDDISGLNID